MTTADLGDSVPSVERDAVLRPPTWILGIGAIAALGSLALLAVGTRGAHWVGYGCGTAITILCVALFRMRDATQSMDPRYSRVRWTGWLAAAVLIIGIVGGCANIYYLAQRVG